MPALPPAKMEGIAVQFFTPVPTPLKYLRARAHVCDCVRVSTCAREREQARALANAFVCDSVRAGEPDDGGGATLRDGGGTRASRAATHHQLSSSTPL